MLKVHRILGVLILAGYALVLWNLAAWVPWLAESLDANAAAKGRAAGGYLVIFGMPVAAAMCWLLPRSLMWRWSPRIPPTFDYLLGETFWIVLGYALLVLAVLLGVLFRSME